MSSAYFTMFDMAISGIPAILFCVWQLISVNREIAKDKLAKEAAEAKAASPDDPGHPVG